MGQSLDHGLTLDSNCDFDEEIEMVHILGREEGDTI